MRSYPAGVSPYGALDLVGNVWEWTVDRYDKSYYRTSPASNPTGPASGQYRVMRGGAWDYTDDGLRSAYRSINFPSYTGLNVGFRCALVLLP